MNKDLYNSSKGEIEFPKEKKEIADGEDLLIYLSKIAKDYNFTDNVINKEINYLHKIEEIDDFKRYCVSK